MQGLNDASMHFGWVKAFETGAIVVEISSKRVLNPGDFLFLEVSAPTSVITFVAYIVKQTADQMILQISSELEERPLKSESRLKVRSFTGQIEASEIEIIDISPNGFGFLSNQSIRSQVVTTAVLRTPQGDVTAKVEVRHSITDKNSGTTRGGALLLEVDRISRARWSRMLGE
jgi:hypothetical protein